MDGQRVSSPLDPGLAMIQKVMALTESQLSTTNDVIVALSEDLEKTNNEQRRLKAEHVTLRQSLREWTQSRDNFSKAIQTLDPHAARICESAANQTVMSQYGELAQNLVEQDKNDLNAIREIMNRRESTISTLRSRIAVLQQDIARWKKASDNIQSMITLQASHKAQLQDLLRQYESSLLPPSPPPNREDRICEAPTQRRKAAMAMDPEVAKFLERFTRRS